MELSTEDSLRLNVLLAQELRAIRIDESSMIVHALTSRGEAKVQLNPTCREDKYLRTVRELFSIHALGSPGGYPVYLKRWTRMGQAKDGSLEGLLLLGEPEAVVAVAHASGLTEEVARNAWWAMPTAEVARRMLENPRIAASAVGKELAAFLLDYLPFETEPRAIVDSIRLVLQPGLIDEAARLGLWKKVSRKSTYFVGFLHAIPNQLPEQISPHRLHEPTRRRLSALLEQQNVYALMLCTLLDSAGQTYLSITDTALGKLADQDVAVLFMESIEKYFSAVCPNSTERLRHAKDIEAFVEVLLGDAANTQLQAALSVVPEFTDHFKAILFLSLLSESVLNPIFSQTDAVGSVMRQRMASLTQAVQRHIAQIRA